MIYIYNKIIKQRQVAREETRERPVPEYKKENWIFLKRNLERKNRLSQIQIINIGDSFKLKNR